MAKAAVLTEALPYIQDFKGSVVLVKLGGSVMEIEENLSSVINDIAFLRAVGIKVVVLHGGGKAISKAIKESGNVPEFVDGQRVTDENTMEIVRRTLNNVVNPDIIARLQATGTNARPLHGNWIFAAERITEPDRGYVGRVTGIDVRPVNEMLDAGIVPVITPIHNEKLLSLKSLLKKKAYYAKSLEVYKAKWPDHPAVKKQFSAWYRFAGVFIEHGKWRKLLRHPVLAAVMYFERLLVGFVYLLGR